MQDNKILERKIEKNNKGLQMQDNKILERKIEINDKLAFFYKNASSVWTEEGLDDGTIIPTYVKNTTKHYKTTLENVNKLKIEALLKGLDIISMKNPELAKDMLWVGYNIPRTPGIKEIRENILYEWDLFGEPFESSVELVSPKELFDFAKSNLVFKCDDPKSLKIGFVHYDLENKKAITKRCKIIDVGNSPLEQLIKENKIKNIEYVF